MQNEALVVELIICVGILCLTLLHPWVRRVATVGLPLSYVLGLAINYWVGALVHALPWYSSQDPFTKAGFLPVLWGTVAFAIGNFLVAPFLLRMFLHGECSVIPQNPRPQQVRLPLVYVSLGVICFTMLVPVLGSIPSIAAVSVCGISLAVVGVCLASWSAYFQRSYLKLAAWLLAICTLPFVTIVTLGFVGYGTAAAVLVLTFVATFYRPRWQAAAGLALLGVLGLSLFVTYLRDRPLIRQRVWGGAPYSERIETLTTTLTNFEFIDFENPRHLASINMRLNQNFLVGRVMKTIEMGQEQFAHGATFYEALLAPVPRILWPGKPVAAGSGDTMSRYTRLKFDRSTSVGIGQVAEFYINFGTPGVVAGFLIMGLLIRILDTMAAFRLYAGDWQGFMSWFLPSMSLLNVGGSFVEVLGTAAASIVLVAIVNRILTAGHAAGQTGAGILAKYPIR